MRSITIGVADTVPSHPDTFTRMQAAARKAGFDGHLLHLAIPARPEQLALCDSVLLMGLASDKAAALTQHTQFRDALSQAGVPYQVIYSLDEDLLAERITFDIALLQGRQAPSSHKSRAPWVWACDKCSDPQCEHRLLTDLIQQRRSVA